MKFESLLLVFGRGGRRAGRLGRPDRARDQFPATVWTPASHRLRAGRAERTFVATDISGRGPSERIPAALTVRLHFQHGYPVLTINQGSQYIVIRDDFYHKH